VVTEEKLKEFEKIVDETVAQKKSRAGETSPWALGSITDAWPYSNTVATPDLIRHYVDALGDENPLFRSEEYARNTIYGGIVAPPTFITCIAPTFTSQPAKLYGWHAMNGGSGFRFFKTIHVWDKISGFDTYLGIEEKARKDRPYRLFIETTRRTYVNQRDEMVAYVDSRFVVTAAHPESGGLEAAFDPMPPHHYSQEELDEIAKCYQSMNENRSGATPQYWEDIEEGDKIHPVVQGPIDVTDEVAMFSATTHICKGFGIKWKQITSSPWYPLDTRTGAHACGAEVHLTSEAGKRVGYPAAVSLAIVMEGGVDQMITNWMGDNGFLKKLDVMSRRPVPLGYTNWINGKVTRKYVENGEHLVDLEIECKRQDDALAMQCAATVLLPSRELYATS